MSRTNLLIPQINCDTKNWTSRITITEDIPSLTCANGSKLKRYVFTDIEGNQIPATVFSEHIHFVAPMLSLFAVYDVTNARVRIVPERYRIMENHYHWVLQRDTFIRPVVDDPPNLRYFLDTLTPFSLIANNSVADINNIDIMGIVLAFEEATTANTANGLKTIQRFTFVDKEKIPLAVTLWEEMAVLEGPILVAAAKCRSTVVAKRLSLGTYKGPALSAKNSSSFAINPPVDNATTLRKWAESRTDEEFQEMLLDKTLTISRVLVTQGKMKIHHLVEVNRATQAGEYWVRALLQIPQEPQRFYYVGCNICNSKTSAMEENIEYTCRRCQKTVLTAARPSVVMNVIDHTATTKVLAIGETAEHILQTTAANIKNLTDLGETYDLHSIKADFENKVFLVLLRRNFGTHNDAQRKLLLATYFQDDNLDDSNYLLRQIACLGKSATHEDASSPMSPLKRQMSEITINPENSKNKKLFMPSYEGTPHESSSNY